MAKARGQVWANRWNIVRPYFERTTGSPLSPGMQVLVCVGVTFHELYGYSLNVVDIDPTFTLGDIARRRQEILKQLKKEGVLTMNKELPLPRLLQRVAVISSASAAGYGDFCNQLTGNVRGLCFRTKLFPAVMQGDGVEASVIAANSRLRPILMTTLTTVLGMIPMAIGQGEGSEMWRSLGMVVAWGLSISTLVTLVIIPTVYASMASWQERRAARKAAKA